MARIPTYPNLPTPEAGDMFHVVDVSDTTSDPIGTSKHVTYDDLLARAASTAYSASLFAVSPGVDTVIPIDTLSFETVPGMFDLAKNGIVAPADGVFRAGFTCSSNGLGTSLFLIKIKHYDSGDVLQQVYRGGQLIDSATDTQLTMSEPLSMSAGDYVVGVVYISGTLSMLGGLEFTRLSLTRG
jgi:hypothetical protein